MDRYRERFRWTCTLIVMAMLTRPVQLVAQNVIATRLQHAAQFLAAGNKERAEDELQSVLRASPEEYRALDLLGVIRVLQHRESDAEDLFRQVVQIKPDFASGHAHLGLLYWQTNRPEEAVAQLREAVRLDRARTDASAALVQIWRDQARAASKTGDSSMAMARLIDARKLAPKNADVQFEFGMAALQMSLWEDAIVACRQTLQLRKDDPMAVWGLGRAFMGQSKFEESRQQFARYIALRPDDSAGHCALGMALAALERSAEARTQFEQSIALTPQQIESSFRLGLLDLDSNDLNAAAKTCALCWSVIRSMPAPWRRWDESSLNRSITPKRSTCCSEPSPVTIRSASRIITSVSPMREWAARWNRARSFRKQLSSDIRKPRSRERYSKFWIPHRRVIRMGSHRNCHPGNPRA